MVRQQFFQTYSMAGMALAWIIAQSRAAIKTPAARYHMFTTQWANTALPMGWGGGVAWQQRLSETMFAREYTSRRDRAGRVGEQTPHPDRLQTRRGLLSLPGLAGRCQWHQCALRLLKETGGLLPSLARPFGKQLQQTHIRLSYGHVRN